MISELLAGGITVIIGAMLFVITLLNPKFTLWAVLNDGTPGAGFFPMIFSMVLVVLGIAMVIKSAREIPKKKQPSEEMVARKAAITKRNIVTAMAIFIAVIVFIVCWKLTKQFYICLFVLTVAVNLLFCRTVRFTVIFSVGLIAFMYLMFTVGFSIQFII